MSSAFGTRHFSDSQLRAVYMEKQILQPLDSFVLAIHEADISFNPNSSTTFSACCARGTIPAPILSKNTSGKNSIYILVTSTEPYLFIDRDHESPFNVGEVMALSDFTSEQVQTLNALHDAPFFPPEVLKLYSLLHGQPIPDAQSILCRQILPHTRPTLRPRSRRRRRLWRPPPKLLPTPAELPRTSICLETGGAQACVFDPKLSYRLKGAGLVKEESGKMFPAAACMRSIFASAYEYTRTSPPICSRQPSRQATAHMSNAPPMPILRLCRKGAFAYVLTFRQMGKSRLNDPHCGEAD